MKPEEITAIIKQQIQDYDVDLNVDDVGTVLDVGDGIAHIYGLERAMAGELLELPRRVSPLAWCAASPSAVTSPSHQAV